ncbi:MAG: hypothetical protein D6690_13875 [Nitrospirae bacterium]|nr:MAG: hypothetical protein D6690_13875 [Nitrospirota bacterium]
MKRFNRSFMTWILLFALVSGTWWIPTMAEEVFLEATREDFQKIPIWVLDFPYVGTNHTGQLNGYQDAVDVLKADLTRSQVFAVQDLPAARVPFPESKCLRPQILSTAAERGITASTWGRIIVGQANTASPGLIFDACAFDTGNKEFLVGKRYYSGTVSESLLRLMIHRWADELVYRYTGEPGIAQTKIVYVSEQHRGRELFVMDYDGYGPQQVTANGFLNLMPAWHPNRRFIVYTAYRGHKQEIVQRELASGKEDILVSAASLNITPAFSPDGKWLAYASADSGNSDIFKLNMETRTIQRLTTHRSADLSPSWSPDGRHIVFTSDRGGRPQLYIMDADGNHVRRLTFQHDYNAAPAWSPRGDWIAYVCRIPRQGFKLCRITPDGRQAVQITKGPSIDDSPSWSPNGRHLVFSSVRRGASHIYLIHRDGTGLERITQNGTHHSSPAWSPL